MLLSISSAVKDSHAGIDKDLWTIAVAAKEADTDIQLMGLYVRVMKHTDPVGWCGFALPCEDSKLYKDTVSHPAGRIDLRIGDEISYGGISRLFSHELRHIGQFHRGRAKYGILTTGDLPEKEIETDCYQFEEIVIGALKKEGRWWYQ